MSEYICLKGNQLELNILVIIFQEDNLWYYAAPSLNLDAYGETEKEAREAFNELLNGHFKYQIENNLMDKDLTQLGWNKKQDEKKKSCLPSYFELFSNFHIPQKAHQKSEKRTIQLC